MKSFIRSLGFALVVSACTTGDKSETAGDSGISSVPADTLPVTTTDTATPPGNSAPSTTPANWVVSLRGIGPITAGMSLDEANTASGNTIIIPTTLQECDFVRVRNAPDGLLIMVEQRKISRVDVQSGTSITTSAGAKIGDSEDRIKSLYPGEVTVQPHKYDANGRYLVVTPASAADKDYRIVFETDGKTVQRFRSGKLPAVQYIEGCS